MKHFIYITLAICAVLFNACRDDLEIPDDIIGDGEAALSASVVFEPLIGINNDSRGTAGDALNKLRNIAVVVYRQEGEHMELYKLYQQSDLTDVAFKNENTAMPGDIDTSHGEHQAQATSYRATFGLKGGLPYGRYRIYVAANLTAPLTDADVSTPELLKSKTQTWSSTVTNNDQMFGYFTPDTENDRSSAGFDAPLIAINKPQVMIHSWIKRLASKVTLVFDPKGLHENIFVYIHKVTIKDIPRTCPLGENNEPGDPNVKLATRADIDKVLIPTGESIYYNEAGQMLDKDESPNLADYRKWLLLDKNAGLQGAVKVVNGDSILHPEDAQSLFFYENMQGEKPHEVEYDKKPQKKDVYDTLQWKAGEPGYKDNVPYGTYIEVEGFYDSRNPSNISNGPIKYRFMLGKDVDYNYNAQRNHHYKLTLSFRGYANQPEWHIEYIEEDPDIFPPAYFYVPYLYNHEVKFPLRLLGNCTSLKAQIVENNWAPYDSTKTDEVPDAEIAVAGQPNNPFRWNRQVYMNNTRNIDFYYGLHDGATYSGYSDVFSAAERNEIYKNGRKVTPIWAGFLALQVPKADENKTLGQLPTGVFNSHGSSSTNSTTENGYRNQNSINGLKAYYLGKGGYLDDFNNDTKQYEKEYDVSFGSHGNGLNSYYVGNNGDGSRTVMIPMFTRPKDLIYISGFTGNNPYETFMRKAVVRFTATFKLQNGTTVTKWKEVPIYQSRRVTNPKGVWRSNNSTQPFRVKMMQQISPSNSSFQGYESYGPWKAYVQIGNKSHFTLNGSHIRPEDGKTYNDTVYGETGTVVDFSVGFASIGTYESACGVVNIEYHGYTCHHAVFLRHGYNNPIQISSDGTGAYWSSYQVYRFDTGGTSNANSPTGELDATLTVNPIALGSMFKRGNYSQGIKVDNNTKWGPLVSIANANLDLTNGATAKWTEIPGDINRTTTNRFYWRNFKANVNGRIRHLRVPTYAEFEPLMTQDFGFGVLYADGATQPAETTAEAFEFLDYQNQTLESTKGMRGVFVYNSTNANQIFFPVGAYGIGRRTMQDVTEAQKGYLRYGSVKDVLSPTTTSNGVTTVSTNQYRPISYNMPGAPGALYWLRTISAADGNPGWDMNYFDMTFGPYDWAMIDNRTWGANSGGDAVPIKPIVVPD